MKKIVLLISLSIFVISCVKKEKITIYNYNSLEPLLEKKDNKTYVVNFWATWCKPCVKELPAFEKLNAAYAGKNVEVILVSLDFEINTALLPFIEKEQLQSKVILLDDSNQNEWIPKIDKRWSGSIPATLIYNKDKRVFYEQSFTYEELQQTLNNFLN